MCAGHPGRIPDCKPGCSGYRHTSKKDREYIDALMKPEYTPGKFAGWISPPKQGINRQTLDFEYVKLD